MVPESDKHTSHKRSVKRNGDRKRVKRLQNDAFDLHGGFETELVQLAGRPLRGCTACNGCFKNKDKKCVLPDDGLNGYVAKMEASVRQKGNGGEKGEDHPRLRPTSRI